VYLTRFHDLFHPQCVAASQPRSEERRQDAQPGDDDRTHGEGVPQAVLPARRNFGRITQNGLIKHVSGRMTSASEF
jgi:hypothetical protein